MTNLTLPLDETIYTKMKKHSEIKWIEFIKNAIRQRLNELKGLEKNKESILTMLASEDVLKRDWDNKEDERWNNV